MTQSNTIHIKVEDKVNKELKRLAKVRGLSVAELVRQALIICYQIDMLGLPDHQRIALEAYRGGYISLGKLSEAMGRSPIEIRQWLNEHGILQNTQFTEDDVTNAQ